MIKNKFKIKIKTFTHAVVFQESVFISHPFEHMCLTKTSDILSTSPIQVKYHQHNEPVEYSVNVQLFPGIFKNIIIYNIISEQ